MGCIWNLCSCTDNCCCRCFWLIVYCYTITFKTIIYVDTVVNVIDRIIVSIIIITYTVLIESIIVYNLLYDNNYLYRVYHEY